MQIRFRPDLRIFDPGNVLLKVGCVSIVRPRTKTIDWLATGEGSRGYATGCDPLLQTGSMKHLLDSCYYPGPAIVRPARNLRAFVFTRNG